MNHMPETTIFDGGESFGVQGMSHGSYGVVGKSTTTEYSGVIGVGETDGPGVSGTSQAGYGAEFTGGLAPLRLSPSDKHGPPTAGSHKVGEFFVDKQGTLYFCMSDGTPGTWKRVQLG